MNRYIHENIVKCDEEGSSILLIKAIEYNEFCHIIENNGETKEKENKKS
jgi:hypothetical protein